MGTPFQPGWEAGLEVQLERRHAVTRLSHLRHWGPLRIQRPFYPADDGQCHLYLLHPPGGMVTGDRLQMDIRLAPGARALLTTPSAGKVYRGNHTADSQRQTATLALAEGSYVEWLPLETIVFDGARGDLFLRIELAASAACVSWDIVCLGRPASGERLTRGYLRQRLEVFRDGVPLYLESNRFEGGSDMLMGRWGLGGHSTAGTLIVALPLDDGDVEPLGALVEQWCTDMEQVALTRMDGLLVARYLGHSAENCRRYFSEMLSSIKPRVLGAEFVEPRIWRT